MPSKAKRFSHNRPGVKRYVAPGVNDDSWRDGKTTAQRGYGSRWQAARLRFLEVNPFCVECAKTGRTVLAKVVDHIVPHRGKQELFWDVSNWQPMCKTHHNIKTGRGG